MFIIMNVFFSLAVLTAVANAGSDVPSKVLNKIAYHQLMGSCWGDDNMMVWYRQLKKTQDECFDLKPTFEINLFEERDHDDHDDHEDHEHAHSAHAHPHYPNYERNNGVYKPVPVNPGAPFNIPQQHALPVIATPTRYGAGDGGSSNTYDAWLAYWAYQQQQQQQQRIAIPANKYSMNQAKSFRRYRRSLDDLEAFSNHFSSFKSDMTHNLANLTCVLSKLRLLDAQLQVNMDTFETGMWEEFKGMDEDFKDRAVDGYRTCHDVSEAVPQEVLDRKPVTKQFGRQMVFFKCVKKMEQSLCAKKELSSWLDAWHGPISEKTQRDLGLPEDKYDAALLAFKIMDHSKSGTEKFIGEFFFGDSK